MPGANGQTYGWMAGQSIEDKVSVGRQLEQTRLGVEDGPRGAGQVAFKEFGGAPLNRRVGLEGPRLGRHHRATDVLGHFDCSLTVGREAVEAWFVQPDPYW